MGDAAQGLAWPDVAVAKRAALWLVILGPLFYLTYGLANYLASLRDTLPNIALGWERAIPFLAWTIIPYWSINLFYVTTLFANNAPADVDRIARRYLTCQIIAVTFFIVFPLRAIFPKPETSGLTGFMFDALGSFDKPFNQAPSLHIALLVIIWDHWRTRLRGVWLAAWHGWCLLIGLSVLTTFQHHFIDIPTGALLGLFALWLFPSGGFYRSKSFAGQGEQSHPKCLIAYVTGAGICVLAIVAFYPVSALSIFWVWPALALAIVAAAYGRLGAEAFQKGPDGEMSFAAYWLLLPYRLGARINALCWTRSLPPSVNIAGGVYLGRFPSESEIKGFASVLDMTAELAPPAHEGVEWLSFPVLDLTKPSRQILKNAAQAIQKTHKNGKVLVCCALGFQRSAAAVALWLVESGRASDLENALAILRMSGRPVHLDIALMGDN